MTIVEHVTISRHYDKLPTDVWSAICRLDEWLEPGLRWRIDEGETDAPHRLVARFWDPQAVDAESNRPRPSTKVTITVEADDDDEGSVVTVHEQRDRSFDLRANNTHPSRDARRSSNELRSNGRAKALAGR